MTIGGSRWLESARTGCLALAVTIGSGAVLAEEQAPAVTEQPATPVAEAQPAPDSKVRADIERLMEVTKSAELGAQVGDLMALQIVQMSSAETPEAVARCREIAAAAIRELLAGKELLEELMPVYERHFTHEEIREMIAFYETPLGKKTIDVMPRVMADSMQIGQRWAARVMPEIQQKVTKQMREEGLLE